MKTDRGLQTQILKQNEREDGQMDRDEAIERDYVVLLSLLNVCMR